MFDLTGDWALVAAPVLASLLGVLVAAITARRSRLEADVDTSELQARIEAINDTLGYLTGLSPKPAPAAPHPQSVALARELFNTLLERTLDAVESIERRAAFLPASVGVVATLSLNNLSTPSGWSGQTSILGAATLVLAVAAAGTAGVCLIPMGVELGPPPKQAMAAISSDPATFDQQIAFALSGAIGRAETVLRRKRRLLVACLAWTGMSLVALILFAVTGGFILGTK